MGFFGALGDLLASVTSADFDCERITIAYAVDDWRLTAGSRATVPLMAGRRRVWRDGKLVLETGESRYGSFYYPGRGTEAVMEAYPLPEAITVPRHAATREVRLLMATVTLRDIFGPEAPTPEEVDDEARAGSRFVLVVEASNGQEERRTIASGRDIYGITAPIIADGALRLVDAQLSGTLAREVRKSVHAAQGMHGPEPAHGVSHALGLA